MTKALLQDLHCMQALLQDLLQFTLPCFFYEKTVYVFRSIFYKCSGPTKMLQLGLTHYKMHTISLYGA